MTGATLRLDPADLLRGKTLAPHLVGAASFLILFWQPFTTLLRDWWSDPDAGHGLLLAPLALYFAWKKGIAPNARPQPMLGLALLIAAVILRYLSGLAAEHFTMRASLLGAVLALVTIAFGVRQLLHWWLSILLLGLCIPLPAVVLGSIALRLQLVASQIGASLLESRFIPVALTGNVIHLPGRTLFVTEACSGLRSLSALLALGLLVGGFWLRTPALRLLLFAAAIPVAIVLNGIRVFLTGFLVYHFDPRFGEGFIHLTEGWVIFVVAFGILGGLAWMLGRLENARPA